MSSSSTRAKPRKATLALGSFSSTDPLAAVAAASSRSDLGYSRFT
jgi:hypothetical protein